MPVTTLLLLALIFPPLLIVALILAQKWEERRLAFLSAIRNFMGARATWEGRPSELFEEPGRVRHRPQVQSLARRAPHIATGRLKRLASFLRQIGINIEFNRSMTARTVRLSRRLAGSP